MTRPLPKVTELVTYRHAAAGHDGVLSDASGELFIKPCTRQEVSFYNESIRDHPEFASFMPTFMGQLTLAPQQEASFEDQSATLIAQCGVPEGTVPVPIPQLIAEHSIPEVVGSPIDIRFPTSMSDIKPTPFGPARTNKIATNLALVLENAASGFVKPNILDVKLGVRLWADDAAPEKKYRFDKVTLETTHKELGFRIAGMRVWQGEEATNQPLKRIDHTTTTATDGYKIYDKNFGRDLVKTTNVVEKFAEFVFVESAKINEELGKFVLDLFIEDLESIVKVMEREESRMYSGSLLFVYEGDGEALRKVMEGVRRDVDEAAANAEAFSSPPTTFHEDSNKDAEGEDGDFDDNESDDTPSPRIYSLKVIDFAHAEWTPGQGPDENSLKGIRSVLQIMKDLKRSGGRGSKRTSS